VDHGVGDFVGGDPNGKVELILSIKHRRSLVMNLLVHPQQPNCQSSRCRRLKRACFEMVFDPNLIEVTRTIAVTVSSCIIADTAVLVDGIELPITTDNDLKSGEGVVVDQVSDFAREGEEGEDGARSRVHLC